MKRRGRGGTGGEKSAAPAIVGAETAEQVLQAIRHSGTPRKYRNTPTEVDGHKFDSKAEAARYAGLYVAQKTGVIRDLEVHPRFPLVVHGQDCGVYEADFSYVNSLGERVVEDVKSPATRKLSTYRLKVKLLWALYGLRVREVTP